MPKRTTPSADKIQDFEDFPKDSACSANGSERQSVRIPKRSADATGRMPLPSNSTETSTNTKGGWDTAGRRIVEDCGEMDGLSYGDGEAVLFKWDCTLGANLR